MPESRDLDGRPHADVSAILGLANSRTVTRIRQTLASDATADRAAREH
ncbi:hypothetical protein [Burkholderia sp. Bp9143]|nr:hypothetical protein [Burkholderia sp. Bp9143]